MYEKTIGRHNLIYYINAPLNLTTVYDLLDLDDRNELDSILDVQNKQRIVIDGYLKGTGVVYVAHKVDGAEEEILSSERYPTPFHNWHKQLWVRGVGQILGRILTS